MRARKDSLRRRSSTKLLCSSVTLDGTLTRLNSRPTWRSLVILNTQFSAELKVMMRRLMEKSLLLTKERVLSGLETR
jgi:hypothetical protein